MGYTPWVDAGTGALRARFRMDPTGSKHVARLVKETNQPDRNVIMQNTAEMRKAAETESSKLGDMSFGRLIARIPIVDFYRIQQTHPDLFAGDPETVRKAVIRFFNSPEGAPYRVRKA